MSPAVLTETVWALAHETPPVIPDRVVVLTTISGRQAIERELLTPAQPGVPDLWQELRAAILGPDAAADPRLMLDPARVIEAPNPRTGRSDWLEDLRSPAENAATANFLLSEVRRWTETPDTRLVLSIAGGRKTMGALLYACASLVGREHDRLTHVLVNEPFDDPRLKPRFYFPSQPCQHLNVGQCVPPARAGQAGPAAQPNERGQAGRAALPLPESGQVLAAQARIDLADIPFVAFRNLFERDMIRKPASFVELVERCRGRVEEIARRNVRLQAAYSRRQIQVNGHPLKLSAPQFLLVLFLAENAKLGKPAPAKYSNALEPLRAFAARLRQQCVAEDGNDWRDEASLPPGYDDQALRKTLNELKTRLRQAGPDFAALVPLLPEKGRFTLDLPPGSITLA